MLTVVVFIIILGFLIFIHELGHFLTARRNGIKAEEFGFGFPPRAIGVYQNEKTGKWELVRGNQHVESKNTVYSLNWLPIGGFVKIKGEDGENKDKDSFAVKSAWTRTKVLAAGVVMNVLVAWLFLSFGFMAGIPQEIDDPGAKNSEILISSVNQDSPAAQMGLQMGDIILRKQVAFDGKEYVLVTVKDVQNFVGAHENQEIKIAIERGKQELKLSGTPKQSGDGKVVLGIGLSQVEKVKYGFFASLGHGLVEVKNILGMMMDMLVKLFSGKTKGLEVTGVVGIAVYTGQVIPLGFVYLLRFIGVLSLNLALINAFPFPALDGGRILFILIEKIKGKPVSQKVENIFHMTGFALLIALMIFVTYRDFINFEIFSKIKGIF